MDDHDSDDVDEDSEEDDGDDEDEMGVERREDGRGVATDSSTAEKEEVAVASDGVEYSEQPPAAICCVLMEPWTSRHQEMPLGRRRRLPLGDPPPPAAWRPAAAGRLPRRPPPPPASGRCTPNSESRRRHPLSVSHRRAAAMPPLPRLLHHHLSLSLLHRRPPRRPWPPAAHAFLRRGLASSSSPAAAAAAGREKSSRRTLAYLLGVAAAMVGASYAAVPLYRRFCQATGYGGTVQRRESVEEKISRHARDGTMTSREIIVQFNADVADGMPWKFIPTQREVRVKPGESALAFYTAENRSSAPITGVSTYNVAPMKGKAKKVVPAQTLWFDILKAQIEIGTPYMLYKDTCNRKSNQQNLGTIKSSNLCTEIIEFTSPTETVVCNLASIALPRFVREKGVPIESHPSKLVGSSGWKNRYFDFDKLAEVTSTVTYNLNKIIDINYYPVETAKRSNIRHRPIGIGVQGLADTFILLGMPFDSPEAQQLNKDIFETIYYHALKASAELAAKEGPYETYEGCPVSKGILQPDMWNVVPSDRWNWPALRESISKVGLRNSLLVAPMPTAY